MLEEFNQLTDLTVKLNSQLKICKILEANHDEYQPDASSEGKSVRQLMDECREQLQKLSKEKEQDTEAYLEEHAEEKVMAMLEIK